MKLDTEDHEFLARCSAVLFDMANSTPIHAPYAEHLTAAALALARAYGLTAATRYQRTHGQCAPTRAHRTAVDWPGEEPAGETPSDLRSDL